MFDYSIWEILTVVLIALIVLGPERLPVVAKKLGAFIRTILHLFDKAKSELDEQQKIWALQENIKKAQAAEHKPATTTDSSANES